MNTHIYRKQRLSCVGCMSSSSVATRNYKGSLSERVGQVLPGDLIVLLMNKPGSSCLFYTMSLGFYMALFRLQEVVCSCSCS